MQSGTKNHTDRTMAEDENHLVEAEHLLAAIRNKYQRQDLELVHFQASRATANVLGITSVLLRVKTRTNFGGMQISDDTLVVKRLPLCQAQLDLVNACRSFEREIEYLTQYVPILEEKSGARLSFVKCYFGGDRCLVMEDLCAEGFHLLVHTIGDLRHQVVGPKHAEAVFRALANLHSASLNFDWLSRFPNFLTDDPFFDNDGEIIFQKQLASAIDGFVFLLEPKVRQEHADVVAWLQSENEVYKNLRKLVKSDEFAVLNHGDPWANNILFRAESTGEFQLKMVDYQLGRFASGACDLSYFLYTSTDSQFRVRHEHRLIQIYVDQFNQGAAEGDKYDFEVFKKHYDKMKLYGLVFAVLCRPMLYMHKQTPSREMSDKKFNEFMQRDYSAVAINQSLMEEVGQILNEIVQYFQINIDQK